ncbi:MAG TPA: LysR family transcriptional regulator [Steroidobacteraceae bacterium]|nr:LysR family transcriptional regulator [Steroidobacteraceae bacterium]
MELLDSRRLRHFLAVYDLRSIGQAAEKLFLTQPALSKSIRQLEEDLEIKLFDRTALGVVPTVYGDALAQHARVIRSEMRHAETAIANLRGAVKGHVTIGVGPSVASSLMPLATEKLRKTKPGIHLTIIEGLVDTILPALRRGELDLAVGAWPRVADSDITADTLVHDRICVVASPKHPLARKRSVQLSDLLEFPWILPPESQRWRQILEETFFAKGLSPPVPSVTSNSTSFIRTVLLDGQSLSYLPLQSLPVRTRTSTLVALAADELSRDVEVTISRRERAVLSPSAHAFMGVIREIAADTEAKLDA